MKMLPPFFDLEKFHIGSADVTQMIFHCDPHVLQADVILMPWWQPVIFGAWVDHITTITPGILFELEYQDRRISVVRSGIGAPQAGDAVLALGCTGCQRLFFAGSVGSLHPQIQIGDLLLPEYACSGDGFCRYLEPNFPPQDCYLEANCPDEALSQALFQSITGLAQTSNVPVHRGPVFSIDTILAQFCKLDAMVAATGCIGIEMETAAVFKAARAIGIKAAALLSVSDVPLQQKTLYAGRSAEEQQHRKQVRSTVLAKGLLDCIADCPN